MGAGHGNAIKDKEGVATDPDQLAEDFRDFPGARSILWVDDNPQHNEHEMKALKGLGLRIDTVMTNNEAVRALLTGQYDLIISDIGRGPPEPETGGLKLPGMLLKFCPRIPPIVYYVGNQSDPETPQGFHVTSRPSELFRLVKSMLRMSVRRGERG